MIRCVKTSSLFLVLALLPASAWGVLSFSNLELTDTSLSVTIEGTIDGITPAFDPYMLFIVEENEFADPGFIVNTAEASAKSFSGEPGLDYELHNDWGGVFQTYTGYIDFIFVVFDDFLVPGAPLEGTLAGSFSSTVFNPSAVTSLEFYWGYTAESPASGTLLGSASLSAVPDTGSTAALLGVGVAALAFARRRLG